MRREEVDVTVEDGKLVLRGERRMEPGHRPEDIVDAEVIRQEERHQQRGHEQDGDERDGSDHLDEGRAQHPHHWQRAAATHCEGDPDRIEISFGEGEEDSFDSQLSSTLYAT